MPTSAENWTKYQAPEGHLNERTKDRGSNEYRLCTRLGRSPVVESESSKITVVLILKSVTKVDLPLYVFWDVWKI